jgi:hypothetical protein
LVLPNGKTFFNFSPNDGMATGGVGDVLAGILGGLIGQEANLKKRDSLYNMYENSQPHHSFRGTDPYLGRTIRGGKVGSKAHDGH